MASCPAAWPCYSLRRWIAVCCGCTTANASAGLTTGSWCTHTHTPHPVTPMPLSHAMGWADELLVLHVGWLCTARWAMSRASHAYYYLSLLPVHWLESCYTAGRPRGLHSQRPRCRRSGVPSTACTAATVVASSSCRVGGCLDASVPVRCQGRPEGRLYPPAVAVVWH